MNHRKLYVKTLIGGAVVILAHLAFAPTFQAGASSAPPQIHTPVNTIASNDQPEHDARASQPPRKVMPEQLPVTPSAQPEQQAAPSAPHAEPKPDEFDGYTTFAMNEIGNSNALSNDSDAHIFGVLGSGSSGGATHVSTRQGRTNHAPGAGHSSPGESPKQADVAPPSDESASPAVEPKDHAEAEPDAPTQIAKIEYPPSATKPVASVPEPSSIALVVVGICGLIAARHLG